MGARRVAPGRLRRRLVVAFALVGGLAAVTLAGGSYALVRDARLDDSRDRAVEQARFNLVLARELLAEGGTAARTDALLAALERRGGFSTVARRDGRTSSSSLSLGAAQVPEDLQRLVRRGQLAYRRVSVAGARYLVVGGRVGGTALELSFFFPEDRLWGDVADLRTILLAGTGLVVALSALSGALVARRTLAPVARASEAARSLAEGLLDTRLEVEREDEFGAWARSFNEMADALETKISALSAARERERRFTSDVAHELRTPLTALVAGASVLAEHLDALPGAARRPAELVVGDVRRLRGLVEDLMEISRLDGGRETVLSEPVRLRRLVDASLRTHGWEGRVQLDGDDVEISSDRRRIERIVANLVGNAVEHGGGGASVRIRAGAHGVAIEVCDRGGGIPGEHLPHVFDRFYKADPARAGSGSGLGLAIAREHARLLGGEVEVASEPGAGSRFTLRLPFVTQPLPAGDGAVSPPREDDGATGAEGRR